MATRTLTKSHHKELVLRLRIPVSDSRDEAVWAYGDSIGPPPAEDTGYKSASPASSTTETEGWFTDPPAPTNGASPSSEAPASTCHHNRRSQHRNSISETCSFEGDKISPVRFRWMSHIPDDVRRGLLLAIEPVSMHRGRKVEMVTYAEENFQSHKIQRPTRGKQPADNQLGVIDNFCVHFSRKLLRKLRDRQSTLLAMANRTCCMMYVKKTLLLRGTWWTKTWTKHFMCRVFSKKETLLNQFYRLLEKFDVSFSSRYSYQYNLPRVTLVPNKTVPENTFLRMTQQRLRKCDDYFGKMPLVSSPYLSNMAEKLTRECVNQQSLLAQMVVLE